MALTDLKSFDKPSLEEFLIKKEGLPAFRAGQLLHWMYEKNVTGIGEITEFSKTLRESLSQKAFISTLKVKERLTSGDGTEKYLFELDDGNFIESVLIPPDVDQDRDKKIGRNKEPGSKADTLADKTPRLTLCISSQAGCAVGCRFCLTGKLGFIRDLEPREIVEQVLSVQRHIAPRKITNIVLMGMGEPLNNLKNVAAALVRLTEFLHFPKRRITLSTAGIAPRITELPQVAPMVNLAVSLNATTDETRSLIMPINKRYGISSLMQAIRRFPLPPRGRITFEYVLLGGINDSQADARRLVKLLHAIPSKVNLIPFNGHEGSEFQTPSAERVLAFQKALTDSGCTAIIRKSKGADILAACGQLKAKYELKK
ncbi:MAG: 23S rRNA (adenine(2503)-C(2))-methyltransferase RlmN [Nitrospiraceae bacterium]|nr:23S rRNA (adenine(2503)-C(2))-methyltransferase RlmN [Nitrospiraceae bacterium]